MQPKLVKTQDAEYIPASYDGSNPSGITPIGDRVLVLTDQAAEQTRGGIYMTDELTERQMMAATTGIIVECGDAAFVWNFDRTREWGEGVKPQAGDRIVFEKYAGRIFMGDDGQLYRIIDDKCIAGLRKQPLAVNQESESDV